MESFDTSLLYLSLLILASFSNASISIRKRKVSNANSHPISHTTALRFTITIVKLLYFIDG